MEVEEKEHISLRDINFRNKIRSLYLEGKTIVDIQNNLDILRGTWENAYYLNHHGFRDFINDCKRERFLQLTEAVSKDILTMNTEENAKMLTIKQKEAEFVRETLLKDHGYTKRSEVIGLNVNKNEPLDEEQKAKLDKLLGK